VFNKVCNKCGIEKEISNFLKDKKLKDGYKNQCNSCVNKRRQESYLDNIDKIRSQNKVHDVKRRSNNERKEYAKNYRKIDKVCVHCNNSFSVDKYSDKTVCDSCVIRIKEENKQAEKEVKLLAKNLSKELNKINKYRQKIISTQGKIKDRTKVCLSCGGTFIGKSVLNSYCSPKCRGRAENKRKEICKGKRGELILSNGNVDKDISLERLIHRDNNTCYLCGESCDSSDYTMTSEGYHIAGNYYPSIDHVIAIANGGTHTWDNILLAHRICNSVKSDKTLV
jgi:hypothetical protein